MISAKAAVNPNNTQIQPQNITVNQPAAVPIVNEPPTVESIRAQAFQQLKSVSLLSIALTSDQKQLYEVIRLFLTFKLPLLFKETVKLINTTGISRSMVQRLNRIRPTKLPNSNSEENDGESSDPKFYLQPTYFFKTPLDEVVNLRQQYLIEFLVNFMSLVAGACSISEKGCWNLLNSLVDVHCLYIGVLQNRRDLSGGKDLAITHAGPELAVKVFRHVFGKTEIIRCFQLDEIELILDIFGRTYAQSARLIASVFINNPDLEIQTVKVETNVPTSIPPLATSFIETDYYAWVEEEKRIAEEAALKAAEAARLEAEMIANGINPKDVTATGKKGDAKGANNAAKLGAKGATAAATSVTDKKTEDKTANSKAGVKKGAPETGKKNVTAEDSFSTVNNQSEIKDKAGGSQSNVNAINTEAAVANSKDNINQGPMAKGNSILSRSYVKLNQTPSLANLGKLTVDSSLPLQMGDRRASSFTSGSRGFINLEEEIARHEDDVTKSSAMLNILWQELFDHLTNRFHDQTTDNIESIQKITLNNEEPATNGGSMDRSSHPDPHYIHQLKKIVSVTVDRELTDVSKHINERMDKILAALSNATTNNNNNNSSAGKNKTLNKPKTGK